jgi:hypothetical protein
MIDHFYDSEDHTELLSDFHYEFIQRQVDREIEIANAVHKNWLQKRRPVQQMSEKVFED